MNDGNLAYCGIDCSQCPALIATQNDDDDLRAKTATEWSAMFHADIKATHISCDGCKSTTGRQFFHCSQCGIRACATDKGFATCAECDEYACDQLAFVIDNVPEAKAALEALR